MAIVRGMTVTSWLDPAHSSLNVVWVKRKSDDSWAHRVGAFSQSQHRLAQLTSSTLDTLHQHSQSQLQFSGLEEFCWYIWHMASWWWVQRHYLSYHLISVWRSCNRSRWQDTGPSLTLAIPPVQSTVMRGDTCLSDDHRLLYNKSLYCHWYLHNFSRHRAVCVYNGLTFTGWCQGRVSGSGCAETEPGAR